MTRVSGRPVWQALAARAIGLGAAPAQPDAQGQDAAAFAASLGPRVAKAYASLLGAAHAPKKAATKKRATKKKA